MYLEREIAGSIQKQILFVFKKKLFEVFCILILIVGKIAGSNQGQILYCNVFKERLFEVL